MHTTTKIFAACALVLVVCVGIVVWHLASSATPATLPAPLEKADIPFGVAGIQKRAEPAPFEAAGAVLWDTSTHRILFEQNAGTRVPMASLTKLMTAMIALDYGLAWEKSASIQLQEYVQGGRLLLHPGEEVSIRDLFHASLVGSANNATLAYVRSLGVPEDEFVQAMNRKAVALGLEQTHFVEVTGLDPDNVSTAYDVARLAEYAFTHYPIIRETTSAKEYIFTVQGTGRVHTIKNTNKLISESDKHFNGSKTGYLYEASYCLVVQGADNDESRIAVLLGSPSEPGQFADILRLLDYPEK